MKRNRNFGMLIGLLVVLAGAAVLLANPFKQEAVDATGAVSGGEAAGSGKLLVDTAKDSVTGISITPAGGAEFRLEKRSDAWFAVQQDKQYKADMERVDQLLEALPGLRSETLVTDKADKYSDLGLSEDKAIKVEVFGGGDKPVASLLAGDAAPGYTTSFVKLADQPEVYTATRNLKSLVGFTYRDFRTKQPWKFDPEAVTKLTVRPVAGQADVYTKEQGVWKTASGANANQNLLATLLHDWSEAKVSDFADDVTPGATPFDPAVEGADSAGTGGKDAAGKDLPAKVKLGTEPNLVAESPQGTFSLTLGVKEAGLYYAADQEKLAYKLGEPELNFFRELKFDELKIPAAEEKTAEGAAETAVDGMTPPAAPAPETK